MKIEVKKFDEEVIKQSFNKPILVDFWAEWCGPCRILAPVLEKLSEETSDWILAKVNTEELKEESARFNIRSIPNVKLFKDGKVIDEFVGALPESQIRRWLEKAIPSKSKMLAEEIQQLFYADNMPSAHHKLKELHEIDSKGKKYNLLFALLNLFEKPGEAETLLQNYEPDIEDSQLFSAVVELISAIKINTSDLPESSAKNIFINAVTKLKEKNLDESLSGFINSIREERYYRNDSARKICIAIFKYLGEEHPTTVKHRRDFSGALYV